MSKLFDFLKSASKAIDDVENVVGKVSKLAESVSGNTPRSEIPRSSKPKSYMELLNQYQDSLESVGPGVQHSFDAYMFTPPFNVTYTLPDASGYHAEGDYGAGEIYEGYSYQNYETANLVYAFELGTSGVSQQELLEKYNQIHGPMTVIEYRRLSDPRFDIRVELANENGHVILYVHGLEKGNWFFAECDIYTNKISEKDSVKVMKDFEDMVAGIQYSDQLKNPDFFS